MSTVVSTRSAARRSKSVGRKLLGLAALLYFYACDDTVLAGPIIALTAKWGSWAGLILGSMLCLMWNIPQTLVFLGELRPGSVGLDGKYARLEKWVSIVGWCQAPLIFAILFGLGWGLASIPALYLLFRLSKLLRKSDAEDEKRLVGKLERLADLSWKYRIIYIMLFFVGPQMSLVPASKTKLSDSRLKRIAYVFLLVYSFEFAAGYVLGFNFFVKLF